VRAGHCADAIEVCARWSPNRAGAFIASSRWPTPDVTGIHFGPQQTPCGEPVGGLTFKRIAAHPHINDALQTELGTLAQTSP